MKNKITIMIPCYNVEKYLTSFLPKLTNLSGQEKANFIFINDASKDNTKKIIEEYLDKFKNAILINNHQNLMKGGALNEGIKALKTKWLFTLDPDDIPEENYLKILLEEINKKNANDFSLIRFPFYFYSETEKKKYKPGILQRLYFKMAFSWSMGINIEKFGIPKYKSNFKMEDMEMYARQFNEKNKALFINKYLMTYCIDNPNSVMNNIDKRTLQDWKLAFSTYCANPDINSFREKLYKWRTGIKIKQAEKKLSSD